MANLKNKIAIVTGGSSGIGEAVVRRLSNEGAKVFFSYRNHKREAEDIVAELKKDGLQVATAHIDLSSVDTIISFFKTAIETFGKPDMVVLDAGLGIMKPIIECTVEDYEHVFNVNSKGTFFCLKEAAISTNDNGSIVIISSSTTAFPIAGVSLYAGSKAPIAIYAKVAAAELGKRGINVNAVMPGVTLTRMAEPLPQEFKDQVASTSPFNRLGEGKDLAGLVYSLVSPDCHWVTGQTILANGGGTQ